MEWREAIVKDYDRTGMHTIVLLDSGDVCVVKLSQCAFFVKKESNPKPARVANTHIEVESNCVHTIESQLEKQNRISHNGLNSLGNNLDNHSHNHAEEFKCSSDQNAFGNGKLTLRTGPGDGDTDTYHHDDCPPEFLVAQSMVITYP